MSRLFFCLALILTSTVLAQAAPGETDFGSTPSFETQGWIPSYAGETELDGLAVIASFDTKKSSIVMPQFYGQQTNFHFGLPSEEQPKALYRLTLSVAHNPKIRTTYSLQRRSVSLDGMPTLAYISDSEDARGFSFLVVIDENSGELKISYTRKTALNTLSEGHFSISPVPSIL